MWSTPRRITGKIASSPRLYRKAASGAQRLAASQEKSLSKDFIEGIINRCSTPRGITGKIANSSLAPSATAGCAQRLAASQEKSRHRRRTQAIESAVLNASRHHRKNRERHQCLHGISSECSTPRGITGKIAFSQSSQNVSSSTCAQRLAASQEKSHRRCGATQYCLLVLNASRHHRKNRLSMSRTFTNRRACSTPRGIT